jgi:hypothetical protein
LDQSFQLEPSQVAGFIQTYRSIIPESVAGANAGATFETYGISLEQQLGTGTYLGVVGEILNSDVRRTVGAFDINDDSAFAVPSDLREHLDYREPSLLFTFNQLIADAWSFGARYRLSQAEYQSDFVDVPDNLPPFDFQPRHHLESVLHQLELFAVFNHRSGFFSRFDALWYAQSSHGYTPDIPGDDFWQFNTVVGYRFPRRKAEVLLGLLNISDQDYHLNPLTIYNELPRDRTLVVRFQLNF